MFLLTATKKASQVKKFKSKSNETIFGKSKTDDLSILNKKKQNDTIKIFVSDDETLSCLIPKLEALKNNWKL